MKSPDLALSDWITGMAGEVPFIDSIFRLLVADFFIPVFLSLILLFYWFGTSDAKQREKNQWGVMCASISLGFSNLAVYVINHTSFDPWLRPFEVSDSAFNAVKVIFYMPHDPSFPANIAATTFGAAVGMWFYNGKASIPLFVLAGLWAFARMYAGVHYPLDVLGGMGIAVIIAFLSYKLMKFMWPIPAACFWIARKLYVA